MSASNLKKNPLWDKLVPFLFMVRLRFCHAIVIILYSKCYESPFYSKHKSARTLASISRWNLITDSNNSAGQKLKSFRHTSTTQLEVMDGQLTTCRRLITAHYGHRVHWYQSSQLTCSACVRTSELQRWRSRRRVSKSTRFLSLVNSPPSKIRRSYASC